MDPFRRIAVALACLALAACASRPVNPPITSIDAKTGYRYATREPQSRGQENLVILTFSGGGTRAAAFSYGVLEVLRQTEVVGRDGARVRLLDAVDVITGVSGGSFTALAYGLYGDKLFDQYEQQFLKRDVEGELLGRFLSPRNWTSLWSANWGRSEMAAELYDEILFKGATFRDLEKGSGPLIMVMATDISTGTRVGFTSLTFDVICSDLAAVPLSRAAAASSAVPLVLSPVTINNYGGSCGFRAPAWTRALVDASGNPARPAARAIKRMEEMAYFEDGKLRPFIHLVDGGLADNLGMRAVLEVLEEMEAARLHGVATPLDRVKRIVVVVVNSLSVPRNNWDQSERPPNDLQILLKATGVPIDRYSYETVELLRDTIARWDLLRRLRDSGAFDAARAPEIARILDEPRPQVYAIDVSFPQLKDKKEFEYLNDLPTSFVLKPEQVDHLRAAAATILLASPDFQQLLKDLGATVVPSTPGPAAKAP